jgi:LysM repeat protein
LHPQRALPLAAFSAIALFSLACLPGDPGTAEPTATPQVDIQAARTVTTAAPTRSPTPLPVLPALTTYVVKSGDYPTLIAEEAGVPADQQDAWIEEMLALNGVEATALQIGQELILPPIDGESSPVARATSRAGNPPAGVLEPQGTPTPKPTAHVGPPPFAATPPMIGSLNATPTPATTATPEATAAQGTRAWLTSSDEAALYYYCDLDSGWTNIPSEKLQAFDSEQELLAVWGRFRTKAPDSVC